MASSSVCIASEILPRVLVMGDSTSIRYGATVVSALEGEAQVHRPLTAEGGWLNCGSTSRSLRSEMANLNWCLGEEPWDVIHFNFGIHDAKIIDPNDLTRAVPLEDYAENLNTIIDRMNEHSQDAVLIFATSTPTGEADPDRRPGDTALYNEVAVEVMEDRGVIVNDLHALIVDDMELYIRPDGIHYDATGSAIMGNQVASSIRAVIPEPSMVLLCAGALAMVVRRRR
jgi:acyl-CoA thioesterase-1